MKHNFRKPLAGLALALLCHLFINPAKAQKSDSSILIEGSVKTIYSTVLKENRKIYIQTPANMNPFDSYPVLYVLDAEAQFRMVAAQVQYLSESYKIIPNLIVVGIVNTDRTRDLTPTHSIIGPDGKPDTSANAFGKYSGGGDRFIEFLQKELMPLIEKSYPVAQYRIIAGHSLGGLLGIHSLVNHTGLFNAYIAISPSLQWDQRALLNQIAAASESRHSSKQRLFFSDANEDPAFHLNQLTLDSILSNKKITGLRFRRAFYPEETHISVPVKAFYDGIRFIYPNWHLPYNSSAFRKQLNAQVIINRYDSLSIEYGYNVFPQHDEVIQISRFLRNDPNRIQDAVTLLKWSLERYANSPAVHETLGDTYLKKGEPLNALQTFEMALRLAPDNTGLQKKIDTLKNSKNQ